MNGAITASLVRLPVLIGLAMASLLTWGAQAILNHSNPFGRLCPSGIGLVRDISGLRLPTAVPVGTRDELFHATQFADVFGHKAEVHLLEDIDHMGITGRPAARRAVVEVANRLPDGFNAHKPSHR